jgi:hypothetical protein
MGCQQIGDLPKSPLNDRQLLPSVGTIARNYQISFGTQVMEAFLIGLALLGLFGVCFFLFVIEPRRKIYD